MMIGELSHFCGNIKFWLMKGFYSDDGRKDSYREDVMRCGELS